MIRGLSRFSTEECPTEAVSQNEILPSSKMKEKTKLKTIEEMSLEELDSQIQVEGEFIVYNRHTICYMLNVIFKILQLRWKKNQSFQNGFSIRQL